MSSKKQTIKYDRRNFRKHSDDNKRMIRKSLEELGAGRSVVIDAEGELIAGNGVYEQAEALGLGVKVVETDGSELVVVKRTDLHTDDDKRKRLAFADNASSDNVEWDFEQLVANIDKSWLEAFGVEMDALQHELTDEEKEVTTRYTRKIIPPTYEPTGDIVMLDELMDASRANAMVQEIDAAEIADDVKAFLRLAAMRHVRFNYARIADYYANADKDVQRLMERSALVIIDFEQAISNGYVTLEQRIRDEYEAEHGNL